MMIFHTWQKVLNGSKTQARRVVKPGECIMYDDDEGRYEWVLTANDRVKWQVGRTYTVQPARTAKGIARIKVTGLRREWVENISEEDVKAEGFANKFDFWQTWKAMHGHTAMNCWVIEFELVQ